MVESLGLFYALTFRELLIDLVLILNQMFLAFNREGNEAVTPLLGKIKSHCVRSSRLPAGSLKTQGWFENIVWCLFGVGVVRLGVLHIAESLLDILRSAHLGGKYQDWPETEVSNVITADPKLRHVLPGTSFERKHESMLRKDDLHERRVARRKMFSRYRCHLIYV